MVGENDSFNMNLSKNEVSCHTGSNIGRALMIIFKNEFQNLASFESEGFLICYIMPVLVSDQFKLSFILS